MGLLCSDITDELSVVEDDPVYSPKAASQYTGVAEGTLANWRSKRIGPKSVKIGGHAVGYRKSALDIFLDGGE